MTRKAAHLQRMRRRWAAVTLNELGPWTDWHRLENARGTYHFVRRRHLRAMAVLLSHHPPVTY